jgi:hypothetical protein
VRDATEHVHFDRVKAGSMKAAIGFFLALTTSYAFADSPRQIVENNTRAVVYIEIVNADMSVVDHGSGFVVSQDGHVVTVAHLKADPTQTAWAVIGQRQGTRFKLAFRDSDEVTDTALWQLPQSPVCRHSVVLSTTPVSVTDRAIALGFPEQDGLTPSFFGISNLRSSLGFYKADGLLRPGNSGGPVFNEAGRVIAFVEGGALPGSNNNDLVPIAPAINLIRKHGVRAGIDTTVPFDDACYASCRAQAHGIERWSREVPWGPVNSGWLPGGHSQSTECKKLVAGALANSPGSAIELTPGSGTWEKSKKDVFGKVEYKYFCKGTLRSGPIFKEKRSSACGLWN